jgi:hypothetical protein
LIDRVVAGFCALALCRFDPDHVFTL